MAAYDSDSSLDDAADYTETNVLLGYASKEATDDSISHMGGHPVWLIQAATPPASFSKCKACNSHMSLLLQLNSELPKYFPDDERRLHILCCRKRTCSRKPGSVRAFRETKKHNSIRAPKPDKALVAQNPPIVQDLGAVLFGSSAAPPASNNANPFSTLNTSSQDSSTNPFAPLPFASSLAAKPPQRPVDEEPPTESFAQKLKLSPGESAPSPVSDTTTASTTTDPWPDESKFPPPFPHFYLDADYEILAPTKPVAKTMAGPSKTPYDVEDSGIGANVSSKDDFESSLDVTFQRFADRLEQNPKQVLRYEFGGTPLLYSSADTVAACFTAPSGKVGPARGIPRCGRCGAQRVFELQLVPEMIAVLEDEAEGLLNLEDGMEWGTIILGVCASDCGVVGQVVFVEEWVGVQWEERSSK